MKRVRLLLVGLLLITFAATGCGSKETSGSGGELTYEKDIKPILDNNCMTCHGSDSPTMEEFQKDPEGYAAQMKGPKYDTYEQFTVVVNGTDAGALMRRIDDGSNTADGMPGNMYVMLGKTDEERAENLQKMKEWVGHWKLEKVDQWTDEDFQKVKAREK